MYSVVLMAALTTTPAVPDWGRRGGGCMGCYACSGCYGGWGYGCSGCSGCWGCYGYGCYGGCYGGGYMYPAYASSGCSGYYGYGCYGGGCYGYGCYGGCNGCSGYSFGYAPAYVAPNGAKGPGRPAEKIPGPGKNKKSKGKAKNANNQAKASNITVDLPDGARLYVDGKLTETRSTAQSFATPNLAPGQMYAYTFRAEVMRDGEKRSDTRRVVFRPGETVRVTFPGLTETATAQTAQADKR